MVFQNKINRNEFIKTSSLAGLNLYLGSFGCHIATDVILGSKLDPYGGWVAKKFAKTGFFRTQRDEKRWWLVTPDGNAFLSFGINHYHEDWWFQEYNKSIWLETFNSQNFRDENWNKGFRNAAFNDMKRLGFNTIGMHTNASSLTDLPFNSKIPYLREYKPLILDHYRNPKPEIYTDVFNSSFEKYCEEYALEIALPYIHDPMLLGYCMADCPILTDDDIKRNGGTSWIRILRNLGEEAPGKQAYLKTIRKRYKTINDFNKVYKTNFYSWETLLNAKNWRTNSPPSSQQEEEDNIAFMLVCIDQYYSVAKKALMKVDPNHLFFGDKINGNTNCLEKVIETVSKYVDVIYYQNFGLCNNQSDLLNKVVPKTNLPFINGDVGFGVPYGMMPNPYGPHAINQKERSELLLECCRSSFSKPEFIGWHVCGIIDTWNTMPTKEEFQHQGLMTVNGEFYAEMELAVQSISSELYLLATQL